MKQKLLFFILLTFLTLTDLKLNAQIKIGNNPKVVNPNALLELESNHQGVLIPRMTTAQRDSAFGTNLPDGLLIYNTDKGSMEFFKNQKGWTTLSTSDRPDITLELTDDHQLILDGKSRVNLTEYYHQNQQLTLSGNFLSLTNGGRVDLSSLTLSSTSNGVTGSVSTVGPPGPQGPAGPVGPPGPQGPPGTGVSSSSSNHIQTLNVVLDGSQLKFNLLKSGQGTQTIELAGLIETDGFSTLNNVTHNTPGDTSIDDFVFGSDQLENKTGSDDDTRMIFDKSKGAFRAGRDGNGSWNESKRGEYSVGLGYNTEAKANRSVALGNSLTTSAYAETVLGSYNETFAGATIGSWVGTDPLVTIGNGTSSSKKSTALTVLKNGSLGIGTNTPDEMLEVAGSILSTGIIGNTLRLKTGGASVVGEAGLYATETAGVLEVVAFDNMGNESTISPHNFSLIGEPIGPMAWSYYSKNISRNMQVNVDMMKLALLVERLSGQKLVYRSDLEGNQIEQKINTEVTLLEKEIKNLKLQNQKYKNALNHLIKRIESLEGVSDP